MSRTNYFYIIGYGNHSGYRIEHDPVLTIYVSTTTAGSALPLNVIGIVRARSLVAVAAVAIVVGALVLWRSR